MIKLNKTLLFINLFFLQSYLLRFDIGGYPSNFQEVLIGANALTLLCTLWRERRWPNIKQHLLVLAFVALSGLSFVANEPLSQIDLLRHLKFLAFAGILVGIFLETLRTEKARLAGLKIAGLGALVFGIFSVFYNLGGYNVTHDNRLLGPLDAAVYLGFYLAPFVIFFMIRWFEGKNKYDLVYAILLGILILATRSMGAVAGSMLVICLYLWLSRGKSLSRWTKNLIIGGLIAVTAAVFYMKILPTIQTEYSSLDERGEIWTTAFELAKDPGVWLKGLGLSQFEAHYIAAADEVLGRPPLDYNVIQPHNIFLLFLFHYGILGVVLLGFLVFMVVKNVLRAGGEVGAGKVAAFMALYLLIHGLIDTPFYKNDMMFLMLLFFSLGSRKGNE